MSSCRQTREWFPQVNASLSAQLLLEKRTNLSKYILIMSGHNFWRRHEYIVRYRKYTRGLLTMEQVGNPYCDLCHDPVGVSLVPPLAPLEDVPLQTTGHIVAECTAFNPIRERIFGIPFAMPIDKINKSDILRFMAAAKLRVLPMKEYELDMEQ